MHFLSITGTLFTPIYHIFSPLSSLTFCFASGCGSEWEVEWINSVLHASHWTFPFCLCLHAGPSIPYGCKPLLLCRVFLWVTMQSSTCTLCVYSNFFCFPHCKLHSQQPPPLLLNLVPHVHSLSLCLTSWHLPYSPAYLLLLPHHICHFSPFSLLSESVGQRDTLA